MFPESCQCLPDISEVIPNKIRFFCKRLRILRATHPIEIKWPVDGLYVSRRQAGPQPVKKNHLN